MKIGIDARLYYETGIGRYIRNLIKWLRILDKSNEYIIFTNTNSLTELTPSMRWRIVPVNIHWHTLTEQIIFPQIISKYDLDLMHFPYFNVPLLYNGKFIVTIHDLTHLKFPTGRATTHIYPVYQLKLIAYKAVLKNALFKAEKVLVPSASVAYDINNFCGLEKDKMIITYEGGLDIKKINYKKNNYGSYILYVGNVYPHKNIESAILALKKLNWKKPEALNLVIVGKKDFFQQRLRNYIDRIGIKDKIIFCGELDDLELAQLYQNAICLISPSLAEGFGLPIIEAMQLGCLIACSDIPVYREICQELPFYFNPNKIDDIAEKLHIILRLSNIEKKQISNKEIQHASRFSWRLMVKKTLSVYQKVSR